MIIFIIIMLNIKVQALSQINLKYRPFSNNVAALHDTVIKCTKFADASTSFKVLKKKADEFGTFHASLRVVFDTNNINNMIGLSDQVNLFISTER